MIFSPTLVYSGALVVISGLHHATIRAMIQRAIGPYLPDGWDQPEHPIFADLDGPLPPEVGQQHPAYAAVNDSRPASVGHGALAVPDQKPTDSRGVHPKQFAEFGEAQAVGPQGDDLAVLRLVQFLAAHLHSAPLQLLTHCAAMDA